MNEHFSENEFYVNITKRDDNYILSPSEKKHHHNSFEIFYLKSGSRTLLINGKWYELSAGDLIIIPPNCLHYHVGKHAYLNYTLHFSKNFLLYYLSDNMVKYFLKNLQSILVIHLPDSQIHSFETIFQNLKYEYDSHQLAIGYMLLLIQLLIRNLPQSSSLKQLSSANGKLLETATKYIYANYHTITTIDEIVENCYVSRSYLCKIFKEELGQGIMHFLLEVKLEHARELLLTTTKSIQTIADECGFIDNSHFSKVFKKTYGKTPRAYRNSI